MTISELIIVALISGGITLAGTLITSRQQARRWSEGEKPKTQADAVESFARSAAQSADTNSKMQDELDETRQRLGELMLRVSALEANKIKQAAQIEDLKTKNIYLLERITTLEHEREALKKRIDDLQTENNELRQMLGKPPRKDTGPLKLGT